MARAAFRVKAAKYYYYRLPSQEWEDIEAKVIHHVFLKIKLYDKNKSSLKSWIACIVDNRIKNAIRDVTGGYYKTSKKIINAKRNLIYATNLKTKIKQVDSAGNWEIRYVPDLIDDSNILKENAILEEFLHILNERELKIFNDLNKGETRFELINKLEKKWKMKRYKLYEIMRDIKNKIISLNKQ